MTRMTITFDHYLAMTSFITRNCTAAEYQKAMRRLMRMEIVD